MSERHAGPVAYTDGGCIGNPGPGGWGVHVEFPDGRVVELGGGELQTTNNRMELRAAIEAARATAGWPSATIVTDSQYVRRGVTEWLVGWKRKEWLTTAGQPVVNRDLWEELDAVAGDHLTWEWTRGHAGDPGNERCDEIASWFASSVRPLGGRQRAVRSGDTLPLGHNASQSARSGSGTADHGASAGRCVASTGVSYISLVDGIVERHDTWQECERRVRGVRAARFKKVRSPSEEQEVFAKWGVTPNDLFGV
jgi:ribonuclease HI